MVCLLRSTLLKINGMLYFFPFDDAMLLYYAPILSPLAWVSDLPMESMKLAVFYEILAACGMLYIESISMERLSLLGACESRLPRLLTLFECLAVLSTYYELCIFLIRFYYCYCVLCVVRLLFWILVRLLFWLLAGILDEINVLILLLDSVFLGESALI